MANIGSLSLKIVANASALKSGLDAAAAQVTSFSGKIKSVMGGGVLGALGGVGPVGAALAATLGLAKSLSSQFKEMSSGIASTGRGAAKLNVAVEDLSALQYAAARSGVNVETLDKALFHLARHSATGDVMKDLFEAADTFNRDDGLNKSAFAFEKFSKAGYAMSGMLSKGTAGIKALQAEALRLGIVLSAADVAKVSAARGALAQIDAVLAGVKNKLVVAIAPAVTDLANLVLTLAPQVTAAATGTADAIVAHYYAASVVVKGLATAIGELSAAVSVSKGGATEFGKGWLSAGEFIKSTLRGQLIAVGLFVEATKGAIGGVMVVAGGLMQLVAAGGEKMGASWAAGLKAAGQAAVANGSKLAFDPKAAFKFAEAFDKSFDAINQGAKKSAEFVASQYQAAGALTMNSREALSVEAKFRTEGQQRDEVPKQQLDEQKKGNLKLDQLAEEVRRLADRFRGGGLEAL